MFSPSLLLTYLMVGLKRLVSVRPTLRLWLGLSELSLNGRFFDTGGGFV